MPSIEELKKARATKPFKKRDYRPWNSDGDKVLDHKFDYSLFMECTQR